MHQLLPRPSHLCGAPRTKCRAERAAAGVLGGWLLSRKLVSNQWYRLSLSPLSLSLSVSFYTYTHTRDTKLTNRETIFASIDNRGTSCWSHTYTDTDMYSHTHTDTEKHEFAFIQGNHTETIFTCRSQNKLKQDYSFDKVFTLILNFIMSSDYYIIIISCGSSINTNFYFLCMWFIYSCCNS